MLSALQHLILRLGEEGDIELQSHMSQETNGAVAVIYQVGSLLRGPCWCRSCGCGCTGSNRWRGSHCLIGYTYCFCEREKAARSSELRSSQQITIMCPQQESYQLDSDHFLACKPQASCQRTSPFLHQLRQWWRSHNGKWCWPQPRSQPKLTQQWPHLKRNQKKNSHSEQ